MTITKTGMRAFRAAGTRADVVPSAQMARLLEVCAVQEATAELEAVPRPPLDGVLP